MSNYIIRVLVAAVKVFSPRTVLEIASFSMKGSNWFLLNRRHTKQNSPGKTSPYKASCYLIWSQLIGNVDSNLCPNSRRSREQKPPGSCTRSLGHSPDATRADCGVPQRWHPPCHARRARPHPTERLPGLFAGTEHVGCISLTAYHTCNTVILTSGVHANAEHI